VPPFTPLGALAVDDVQHLEGHLAVHQLRLVQRLGEQLELAFVIRLFEGVPAGIPGLDAGVRWSGWRLARVRFLLARGLLIFFEATVLVFSATTAGAGLVTSDFDCEYLSSTGMGFRAQVTYSNILSF
jgi:hypothetical protein